VRKHPRRALVHGSTWGRVRANLSQENGGGNTDSISGLTASTHAPGTGCSPPPRCGAPLAIREEQISQLRQQAHLRVGGRPRGSRGDASRTHGPRQDQSARARRQGDAQGRPHHASVVLSRRSVAARALLYLGAHCPFHTRFTLFIGAWLPSSRRRGSVPRSRPCDASKARRATATSRSARGSPMCDMPGAYVRGPISTSCDNSPGPVALPPNARIFPAQRGLSHPRWALVHRCYNVASDSPLLITLIHRLTGASNSHRY